MKKRTLLLLTFCISLVAFSQVPEKMNYQAVIRNSSGALIKNSTISLKISILNANSGNATVYTETHATQTNENGLITVEIGSGVTQNNISNIEWAKSTYRLKVEANVNGENIYDIVGTSQLLSVPYALHAKTAEQIVKGIIDEPGKITGKHYIGELFGGGIVFYIDSSHEHGLIVSMCNLSNEFQFSNVVNKEIGASAQSDVKGKENSQAIISQGGTTSAAKLCFDYENDDYSTGKFTDWYLPSLDEMRLLSNNIYQIQSILENKINTNIHILERDFYWTSTEYNAFTAWGFNFYNGNSYNSNKFTTGKVRAIRSF